MLLKRKHLPILQVGLTVLAAGTTLGAPNFPPVAVISVSTDEALTGDTICFSGTASVDPDDGPLALTYFWDFEDGNTSSLAEPKHAFVLPGAYVITLTVDDGADSAVTVMTVYVLAPPTARRPSKSSALTLSPDGKELWVVNEDSHSVSVVELPVADPAAARAAEIPLGRRPRTIALSSSGTVAYVTEQEGNSLSVLDTTRREVVRTLPVGHRPYGVALVPDDGRVLVSLQGAAQIVILDVEALRVRKRVPTAEDPRAIAITHDGSRALVAHFISRVVGKVSVLDLDSEKLVATIELQTDLSPDTPSSGRGVPNLLATVAIEPAGTAAWVGGLKSNILRGLVRDGEPLNAVNRVRGVIMKIDLLAREETRERRIDLNNAGNASDVGFSPGGRYAYVTHQGIGSVSVYDLAAATRLESGDGSTVPFASRIPVGDAPRGIVVSADGRHAYVLSFLSRSVAVLDLTDPERPTLLGSVAVTAEPLPAPIANGKRLFHRSTPPQHSSAGYIACASCHPDGAHDGQTWDFTDAGEGLRNTVDLRGRGGMEHGPVHWSANFDEIQDFENDIVKGFGGTGLAQDGQGPHPPLGTPNAGRSKDLDDLAAYVSSLTEVPSSPFRSPDGSLTDAALRGRELFFREDTGCATCHVPPRFTDSTLFPDPAEFVLHDVGTIRPNSGNRLGGRLPGLDTPTLKGVWATAPYLHDGSALTLMDVLTRRNADDRHGQTSHLSPDELQDMAVYLLSLDESAPGVARPFRRGDSNCDGTVTPSDANHSLEWIFLGGLTPCCLEAADSNDDGGIDVSDAIFSLRWLFLGAPPPPEPGPLVCGVDPEAGVGSKCDSYPADC